MRQKRDAREDYLNLVEQIKQLSMVQVYDRYLGGKLRFRGNKAVAQCPWHGRDSSPSLTIYIDKNNWACFGCRAGGTVIDLVMKALGVDFKAAVSVLSRDFGISDSFTPDPVVRKKIIDAKEKRDLDLALETDLRRMLQAILLLRQQYNEALQTYSDYETNPDLVHERSMLDYIFDLIADAREADEKLRAWRIARKVFPCLKT